MMPVIFSFGPFHLYSYGLLLASGMLLALYLMRRRAAKEGFPRPDDCSDVMLALFIWGFSGARLFYVAQNLSYFLSDPLKIFAVWEGGLIFYGGAITATVGFYVTAKLKKIPFWKLLDFFTPYTALVQFFGRVGCFLNGCCFGKACDLPWGVHFPLAEGLVHPAQVYEALYDLVLFTFLLARSRKAHFEGEVGLLYFMLYGFGRYLIEFVRESERLWFGFTLNQWISVGMVTVASFLFLARRRAASR